MSENKKNLVLYMSYWKTNMLNMIEWQNSIPFYSRKYFKAWVCVHLCPTCTEVLKHMPE